jgi:hypothetical protein
MAVNRTHVWRHVLSISEHEIWKSKKKSVFCKIWGFHGGDYEERRLLGSDAV